MVKLSKPRATMELRSGANEAFLLEPGTNEEITNVVWTFKDTKGRAITLPKFSGQKGYEGVRALTDKEGVYIRAGDSPVYVEIKIDGEVTVKDKKGVKTQKKVSATVDFTDFWGGMAKAWYPYPDDYEMAWNSDWQGKRAVALLHEMIALLPDEFRRLAGSIPIIRTSNPKSLRGDVFRGAHLPLLFDTIQISNKLVASLKKSPIVTPEDVEFCVVVLHEIAHAATYRNCLWGTHQAMATIRKFLRKPVAPVVTWWPAAALTVPTFVLALAQQVIAPRDIVSDFSEVSGWELTSWLARAARMLQVPATVVDFGQWLWRIPSQGLNQDYPIRPNVVVGNSEFGALFGLQARFTAAERAAYDKALKEYNEARRAWEAAAPGAKAAAKGKMDKAWKAFAPTRDALKAKGAAAGFVSEYATSDALEDIAETLAFFLVDQKQLSMIGEYFGDLGNKRLKAKRKFFVDNRYLPASKKSKPMVIGSFWQGYDELPYLDRRFVRL